MFEVKHLKNVLFVLSLLFSSFMGSIFILLPMLLIYPFSRKFWRLCMDHIIGYWEFLPMAFLELIHGVRVQISGDKILRSDNAIIIMNHRTRLDWLFFWNALLQIDWRLLFSLKIILKSALKGLPGAGWAMQCNAFIFLDRNWEKDEMLIRSGCRYLTTVEFPYQILIFPEGTDYCEKSRQKSSIFASQHNLENLQNLLHPRITGLACLISEMMKSGSLDCIYDVTIAYPDLIVQTEFDFALRGHCPAQIHFDVKRVDLKNLPFSSKDQPAELQHHSVSLWCRRLWVEKDLTLARYYQQKMPDRKFDSAPARAQQAPPTFSHYAKLGVALTFWTLVTSFFTYQTLFNWYCTTFCIFGVCAFKFVDFFYGGLEQLLVKSKLDSPPIHTK